MFHKLCLFFLGAIFSSSVLAADPLPRPEVDKRIKQLIFDNTSVGVELYNAGKVDECLGVYKGTLMAVVPLLDHRPELAKAIDAGLKSIKGKSAAEAAFALRKVLDDTSTGVATAKKPLWERLGGEAAVKAVVKDFVTAAAPDPKVNFSRGGKYKLDAKGVKTLETRLVELVSAVTGGPLKYSGKDMKSAHTGMGITDDEFDAIAGHLAATLKKFNVPQAETDELMAIVGSTRGMMVEVSRKPLWDRLGGEAAVTAVVQEFLTTSAKDPKANIDRNGNYPITKERGEAVTKHVVALISSVTGGPLKYEGRDMKNAHQGMKITEAEFDAAAGHLVAALKKFKVPEKEMNELLTIVGSTKKDMVEKK